MRHTSLKPGRRASTALRNLNDKVLVWMQVLDCITGRSLSARGRRSAWARCTTPQLRSPSSSDGARSAPVPMSLLAARQGPKQVVQCADITKEQFYIEQRDPSRRRRCRARWLSDRPGRANAQGKGHSRWRSPPGGGGRHGRDANALRETYRAPFAGSSSNAAAVHT
jgi:hypothetical protein